MTKKQKKVLIRIIVSAVLLTAIMITTKLVEINKWIQQGIEYFRENNLEQNPPMQMITLGDLLRLDYQNQRYRFEIRL